MKAGSFPFVANFQSFGEKPKIHTTTAAAVIDSKSLYNRIYALFSFVPPLYLKNYEIDEMTIIKSYSRHTNGFQFPFYTGLMTAFFDMSHTVFENLTYSSKC